MKIASIFAIGCIGFSGIASFASAEDALCYELLDGTEADVSGEFRQRQWPHLERHWRWRQLQLEWRQYSAYSEVSVNTSLFRLANSYSLNGTAGFPG
jgi:fibronectin-binding autotransporter adhesin